MSGTRGAMRCETEVRRQQVRMTRLLPKLSEHRPITNIPSPYPADPAACGNRAIRHLFSQFLGTRSLCILQKKIHSSGKQNTWNWFKGSVSSARLKIFWQKFTELCLTKDAAVFFYFLGLWWFKNAKRLFVAVNASLHWLNKKQGNLDEVRCTPLTLSSQRKRALPTRNIKSLEHLKI